MEINRNQWFMFGLVLLFIGLQLRIVDSYVLTDKATQVLAEKLGKKDLSTPTAQLMRSAGPPMRKIVRPPEWLGWALMSIGSVLVLHSLAMPKPSG